MKRILQQSIMLVLILAFTACNHDQLEGNLSMKDVPEGYVAISFKAQIPDMTEVQTRGVDPDGLDIHNMKLFCFNSYGVFITVEYATLSEQNHTTNTGKYDAIIPSDTHIIHFVANQNIGQYDLTDFAGKNEHLVLSAMEGGSGMMIYWRRMVLDENSNESKESVNLPDVTLIRNQAKVSIQDDKWNTESFTVTGFRTTNIHAYGTVAPFKASEGGTLGSFPETFPHNFVTFPENTAKLSDIIDVNTAKADYIFEHENTLDDPISVIIRGKNAGSNEELYYRVLLLDDNGEPLKVLRNHHYSINIVGKLSYGQKYFQDALTAPATNNVWVAVDDWVNEISYKDANQTEHKLGVEETHIVLDESHAGQSFSFDYTASRDLTINDVTWLEGNNVANETVTIGTRDTNGKGQITISLKAMSDGVNQQSGTLMLKMGQMYRKVNITVVKEMNFIPSWVSANVFTDAGQNITLKFTVPDNCPEGLFPFPVMVSVNDLDVRHSSGMELPVRYENEVDWYGDPNELGYKYEYLVEGPGVHRLYFTSVLPHTADEKEVIKLEAEFFETLTKEVNFVNFQHQITLPVYDATNRQWGFHTFRDTSGENFQKDESIYYLLVPQKEGAEVRFDVDLDTREGNGLIDKTADSNDQFFLYSKTLNLNSTSIYTIEQENMHETDGRRIPFKPNGTPSTFEISATTKLAKSADVVRISSDNKNSNSSYLGDEYRSAIFELANYRPFGFAAQIAVNDGVAQGSWGVNNVYSNDNTSIHVETVDNIELSYEPNQKVSIAFDVTSFIGSDGKEVDPFGQEFEIYIDAPMLELGNLEGTPFKGKITTDNNGRFIYTVNANRDAEKIGSIDALSSGIVKERKSIPFVKKGITVVGDIVLSTDESKVVFYKKTFKVTTKHMTGSIKYGETESSTLTDVPKDAFVAFIRTATNSRIGVMTITAAGQYSLNLRSEYVFDWTDKIDLDYKKDGVVYDCNTIQGDGKTHDLTLETLFKYKNVILTKAEDSSASN